MDEQAKYKADLLAKRNKLKEDIATAVAAEEFDQTNAGKLQKDWVNFEVNTLVKELLDEKQDHDGYIERRAKIAVLREFLDHLNTKQATRSIAEKKLGVIDGQLTDIKSVEQQQRANQPPNA